MFHGEKFSFGKTDVTRFEDTNLMLRKKIEPCLSNLLGFVQFESEAKRCGAG